MGGPEIERLIALVARLPGLGPRSARRAVLHLLQAPESRMAPLAEALATAALVVKVCGQCGNLDSADPCAICSDLKRDQASICVVEGVGDLWAMERASIYRGLYHILGGVLSPLSGARPEDLRLTSLLNRLAQGHTQEVILALSATVDGATTAFWLIDHLKGFPVTVTKVAQGMPIGGMLEALDDGTLAMALKARH